MLYYKVNILIIMFQIFFVPKIQDNLQIYSSKSPFPAKIHFFAILLRIFLSRISILQEFQNLYPLFDGILTCFWILSGAAGFGPFGNGSAKFELFKPRMDFSHVVSFSPMKFILCSQFLGTF